MNGTITLDVHGVAIDVTNPHKVLYPETGFTKGDVIDFYLKISPFILPHLLDRAIRLERCPDDMSLPSVSAKPCSPSASAEMRTAPVAVPGGGAIDTCLVNDLRALVWAANRIDPELHTFLHQAKTFNRPTALVFDLDPGPPAGISQCCLAALQLRTLLEELELRSFPNMSGSRCLQIHVPLNSPVTYTRTKAFAKRVAEMLESHHPGQIVSRLAKNLRRGKVFVDWSQNDARKTMVSVYSLRARKRPTVSTPVTWEEVARAAEGKTALRFEAHEVLRRVEKKGDLFAPVLELRQKLPSLPSLLPRQ